MNNILTSAKSLLYVLDPNLPFKNEHVQKYAFLCIENLHILSPDIGVKYTKKAFDFLCAKFLHWGRAKWRRL